MTALLKFLTFFRFFTNRTPHIESPASPDIPAFIPEELPSIETPLPAPAPLSPPPVFDRPARRTAVPCGSNSHPKKARFLSHQGNECTAKVLRVEGNLVVLQRKGGAPFVRTLAF